MRYRAGAYDKGSKTKGKFFVVEAVNATAALLDVRKHFSAIPLGRMFAVPAEDTDKVDGTIHEFKPTAKRGAQ